MRVGLGPFTNSPSGMEVGTLDTALGLHSLGADVTIFAADDARLPERAAPVADRVVRLAPLPGPEWSLRVKDGLFLPYKLLLSRRMAEAVRRHPVDLVHTFSPGCVALVPESIPSVAQAWFHPPRLGARMRTYLRYASRFPPVFAAVAVSLVQANIADGLGYRRARKVLTNTPTAERAFRERGIDALCLPPSIEMPAQLPEREPSDTFRVAFCAHPLEAPRKGLEHLLEAAALLGGGRPLKLTLVGGPSPALEHKLAPVRAAGVEVELTGKVPRERYLEQLAHHTDVVAFMSLYEEWGYALFEAFSCGVPAVAFDLYPFHDLVGADTGLLARAEDPEDVARALREIRDGKGPTPEAVLESTRRRFGSGAIATRLIELYERLLR